MGGCLSKCYQRTFHPYRPLQHKPADLTDQLETLVTNIKEQQGLIAQQPQLIAELESMNQQLTQENNELKNIYEDVKRQQKEQFASKFVGDLKINSLKKEEYIRKLEFIDRTIVQNSLDIMEKRITDIGFQESFEQLDRELGWIFDQD
ncbi:Hypothetical_protein [Hexamita inflata]|uniref:Hypothetical_protein n=1 Tax=Hexamita inflata TaxID=28002 RepID=A0AA86NDM2_9EUKA|nr:Hypothetical protein HINF_LOCUS4774 [Hexamita inflata]